MSIAVTATKVFALTGQGLSSGCFGVVQQQNGTYLAGFHNTSDDYPYPSTGYWYKSTDQGASWSTAGTSAGLYGQAGAFAANVHANILLAPAFVPPTNTAKIIRSTNQAASFSDVFSEAPASSPNGRQPFVNGVLTYNRTHAIAWGQLDGNKTHTPRTYGLSDDAGATWTTYDTFDLGDSNDLANACGIADGGRFYLQYTRFGGANRVSAFARTDDAAANWTPLSAPPGGTGTPPNHAIAIACFTDTDVALAGRIGASPISSQPGLWYSDDAGVNLTLLSSSDVADWPSGSFYTYAYELKRLTRDAALLGIDQQNGTPGSPWRITLDKGHTYPITVTPSGSSWRTYQTPFGSSVVTRDGHILCTLWASDDYNTADLEIWRLSLSCS